MTTAGQDPNQRLYTRRFFLLFIALFAFMAGYSMLVHLGKYVTALGGDIAVVSQVFGIGMVGSLLTRPFVGRWIDRAGSAPVMLAASLGGSLAVFACQFVGDVAVLVALRVILQLCLASFLATVAVVSARLAPSGRSAESLASVGMGGLAGLMIGPAIGDLIFRFVAGDAATFRVLFNTSAALTFVAAMLGSSVRVDTKVALPSGPRESFWRLTRRYWPGTVVLMGISMALAQTVPQLYIERYTVSLGIPRVWLFFACYSPIAILLRVVLRTMPARIGRRRTLILGISCYALGVASLTLVRSEVGLILPALIMGTGHCFSYPFLVDLAAQRMPPEHRGVATSLILGVVDIGFLLGFLVQGWLMRARGFHTAFLTIAAACAVATVLFAWSQRGRFQPWLGGR